MFSFTTLFYQCFQIVDIAIINIDNIATCSSGTGQLLKHGSMKKHNRCILHTEGNRMLPKKPKTPQHNCYVMLVHDIAWSGKIMFYINYGRIWCVPQLHYYVLQSTMGKYDFLLCLFTMNLCCFQQHFSYNKWWGHYWRKYGNYWVG